jgi:iron complex outermembrane receptor protein
MDSDAGPRSRFVRKLPCFLLCTLLIMAAGAQQAPEDLSEASLEQLMEVKVYSASKHLQSTAQAPSSVTVITAEQIRKYGYRTLADVLRSVRGFYVTYDRNYSYIGVRGFGRPGDYNTRLLLLVDGHRLNDNVYDQALSGAELPLPLQVLERVEIIRGPSASLYGTSAFFGVINLVTQRPRKAEKLQLSAEAGSFGTGQGGFNFAHHLKGIDYLLSAEFSESAGQSLFFPEFNSPATNHGVARDADGEHYRKMFGSASFGGLTVQGLYGWRKKTLPTAPWDTVFNDSRSYTRDARAYIDLHYARTWGDDWDLSVRTYFDRYRYDGFYIYEPSVEGDPLSGINADYGYGDWWGEEVKLSKTLWRKHRVTAGSEFRHNLRQDQRSYYVSPWSVVVDEKRDSQVWGFYLQDEFTIHQRLLLNAGLRYDHHAGFHCRPNPRIALIYQPRDNTTFKFLYGTSFRAPNVYENYYYYSSQKAPLKPETIQTSEVVWEELLRRNLRVSVSGFYNKIDDLISQQLDSNDGSIFFSNLERAKAAGLEMEIEGKLRNRLEGGVSYTYAVAKDRATHAPLSNSPHHLAKLHAIAPLAQGKLFAAVDAQFTSGRRLERGGKVAGFAVVNLTLSSRPVWKGLSLSASLYNLFDKRYADPGADEHRMAALAQDGRNFRVRLSYHFERH